MDPSPVSLRGCEFFASHLGGDDWIGSVAVLPDATSCALPAARAIGRNGGRTGTPGAPDLAATRSLVALGHGRSSRRGARLPAGSPRPVLEAALLRVLDPGRVRARAVRGLSRHPVGARRAGPRLGERRPRRP